MTEEKKPEEAAPVKGAEAGAGGEGAAEPKKEASSDAPRQNSVSEKEGAEQPSEAKKEGGGPDQPKRRSFKDGTDAKRKSTRKSVKAAADHADGDLDDDDEEKEEEAKVIYPLDKKIQETLRTAWTLFVKKNQKKKTEISEAQVSPSL